MSDQPNAFAVFSGGGVRAAAFVGAIEEAQQHINFVGYGGASAGSIAAMLLSCGYDLKETRDVLLDAPYEKFFKVSTFRFFNYPRTRGVVDPQPLLDWLRSLIARKLDKSNKGRVLFRNLPPDADLRIAVANVTQRDTKIYSRKRTPDAEIANAVLASCSFPFFFPPVQDGDDELLDGGILSNCPIWLFDEDRDDKNAFADVLGFSLFTKTSQILARSGVVAHIYSIFHSVIAAQDFTQEKYMDPVRSSNILRILVDPVPLFKTDQSRQDHENLIRQGAQAARAYFSRSTHHYGKPVDLPWAPPCSLSDDKGEMLSSIVRQHILYGGVAQDSGVKSERVLMKYYIDLMGANSDHKNLDALVDVMRHQIQSLDTFDRIIGIKKGNPIFAQSVARALNKPVSIFKTDMSFKMGAPFDGQVSKGERVIIIDDVACDSTMLENAIKQLLLIGVSVHVVYTLIDRLEGNARINVFARNVVLKSVCEADDAKIDDLIKYNKSLPLARNENPSSR